MINYFSHTLANGLRIVHKPVEGNVSYAGFIINAGTRDEDATEFGMAHFIEHMLFKGTGKRTSRSIINRIESIGGELNAYTNKEETVVYAAFLEQHFERVFELMADMTFNSEFPQNEIDKEVEVIIDEIHSYEDSPAELIFDEFENLIFNNTELGHNILGTEDSLLTFDTSKAKRFYKEFYVPENIVFFSLGSTNFTKVVRLAEKYLSVLSNNGFHNNRQEVLVADVHKVRESKDTSQAHVVLGAGAYNFKSKNRTTLYLLNNILGGPGMNSRLNLSLREKKGYVYNVESSVSSYSDTGMFSIYFGADKKNLGKCLKLVFKELEVLRNTKLSATQLSAAKKQLMGQIGINGDNKENTALALGKSFLHYNHFDSQEETLKKISDVDADSLLRVANEILTEQNFFALIYD